MAEDVKAVWYRLQEARAPGPVCISKGGVKYNIVENETVVVETNELPNLPMFDLVDLETDELIVRGPARG